MPCRVSPEECVQAGKWEREPGSAGSLQPEQAARLATEPALIHVLHSIYQQSCNTNTTPHLEVGKGDLDA